MNYLGDLKYLSNHQKQYINKILKDNCDTREYDLMDIEIYESRYIFIIKDVDKIEKLKLLVSVVYEDSGAFTSFRDSDNNPINIYEDDEDSYDMYGENIYYWLAKQGYSERKTYKLDANNI